MVGDWLLDKDITAPLTDKLYHDEIGDPRAWATTVVFIVSHLDKMNKCEDSQATRGGLAWGRRLLFVDNSDDKEGHHWFVCAMDCTVPVWAFKVWIWEPRFGTSLIRPMLKRLLQNGVYTCSGFGFSK